MTLTIEKLPRQTKYNAKIQHFVVKLDGAEIGVIEKTPKVPWIARLMFSFNDLGEFKDRSEAAKAIYRAHENVYASARTATFQIIN